MEELLTKYVQYPMLVIVLGVIWVCWKQLKIDRKEVTDERKADQTAHSENISRIMNSHGEEIKEVMTTHRATTQSMCKSIDNMSKSVDNCKIAHEVLGRELKKEGLE
jgi:hypothetical protein